MKLAKSFMTILIAATFAIAGCMQQESTEMGSSTEVKQVSNLDLSDDVQMIIIQKAISLILPMLVYFQLLMVKGNGLS